MPYSFLVTLDGEQHEPDAIHDETLVQALVERIKALCDAKSIHVPGWTFTVKSVSANWEQPLEPSDEENKTGR